MNPHLNFAQAMPGICFGRGIGIIDTLHLVDVVFAIEDLRISAELTEGLHQELQKWFAAYLGWMLTSVNGIARLPVLWM